MEKKIQAMLSKARRKQLTVKNKQDYNVLNIYY